MNTDNSSVKRHALFLFFVLAYGFSWGTFFIMGGPFVFPLGALLAAFIMASLTGGLKDLLSRMFRWRVGIQWYAAALLVPATIATAALYLNVLLGAPVPTGAQLGPWYGLFLLFPGALLDAPFWEETGWRGFALPKLLGRRSALFSALLVGVLWGTVHLALHLPGLMFAGWPWPATMLELIGISVVITWLFVNTRGSLVIVTLYHAAQNFFLIVNEGISGPQQLWLMVMSYAALVLILIALFGPALRRGPSDLPAGIDEVQLVDPQTGAAKRVG